MSRQRNRDDSSVISKVLSITTLVLIGLFFIESVEQLLADDFTSRVIINFEKSWRS
ncbi:hypothetical protein [uncultured Shewanella sp.]|uniref:hypothetical protein n=1 Tax=uncultured Shewanella sp. TaxID=173975 RepID=UPI00261F696E|nr:hypothetical protein [uncultured Shewanella sp.]